MRGSVVSSLILRLAVCVATSVQVPGIAFGIDALLDAEISAGQKNIAPYQDLLQSTEQAIGVLENSLAEYIESKDALRRRSLIVDGIALGSVATFFMTRALGKSPTETNRAVFVTGATSALLYVFTAGGVSPALRMARQLKNNGYVPRDEAERFAKDALAALDKISEKERLKLSAEENGMLDELHRSLVGLKGQPESAERLERMLIAGTSTVTALTASQSMVSTTAWLSEGLRDRSAGLPLRSAILYTISTVFRALEYYGPSEQKEALGRVRRLRAKFNEAIAEI